MGASSKELEFMESRHEVYGEIEAAIMAMMHSKVAMASRR